LRAAQALLAETFIADMDGELRQMGVGDLMVGKHVGNMMGALGGRVGAYKEALAGEEARAGEAARAGRGDLSAAIARNIFRDEAADPAQVAAVEARLRALAARVDAVPLDALLAGRIG